MKKMERINQLVEGMKSFTKERYFKNEIIDELINLENEVINKTFNTEHADEGNFKLWQVEKHLECLNEELGNVAYEELIRFKEQSKILTNEIKKQIAGNKGERYAAKCLETLKCHNVILSNVELVKGNHKSEIDFIVLTQKAIYLLEIKNTKRDVVIDERGNYIKVRNESVYEKPLGENMNEKEYLLRNVLEDMGYKNLNIITYVVFTNNQINVENNYDYIKHCFMSNLLQIINNNNDEYLYSVKEMARIANGIKAAEAKQEYQIDFDAQAFKLSFASLMATLEAASMGIKYDDEIEEKGSFFNSNKVGKLILAGLGTVLGIFTIKSLVKASK